MKRTCTLTEAERKKQNEREMIQILKKRPDLAPVITQLVIDVIQENATTEQEMIELLRKRQPEMAAELVRIRQEEARNNVQS